MTDDKDLANVIDKLEQSQIKMLGECVRDVLQIYIAIVIR